MSFDWQQDSKEKYYVAAEKAIKAAGFDDLLKVDRGAFGTMKDNRVKVHIIPFRRDGNTKHWWEAKRNIENLYEQQTQKDSYGRKQKTILIHGFMLFEMEESDK